MYIVFLKSDETNGIELWLPAYNSRIDILDVKAFGHFLQCSSILCENKLQQLEHTSRSETGKSSNGGRSRSTSRTPKINMLCCCTIENSIWMGDCIGNIHCYRYL